MTPALDDGGVEGVTLDIAAAVARAGGRSLVASRGGRREGALARDGARLIRMPLASRNPFTMAANAARLAGVVRRERVSLIHVRSRNPAFSALSAARATGRPLIATYHGIYPARSALKRWYNAVMTRGDLVIANSAYTRDHILAEHGVQGARVVVVTEGIDTDVFDPAAVAPARVAAVRANWRIGEREERPVVLLAGRLTSWKGQRLMVEALGGLPGRGEVILILAGGGGSAEYLASIEAAAAVAGISDTVRLVGDCEDMPAAYLAADLVVAPSTAPESFGRGVAEAGAMERPVLASTLGGPAETIADGLTGWLVASTDPKAWAAAVQSALTASPQTRAAIGQAARARVKRLYSLSAMCAETFGVYRRVVEAWP